MSNLAQTDTPYAPARIGRARSLSGLLLPLDKGTLTDAIKLLWLVLPIVCSDGAAVLRMSGQKITFEGPVVLCEPKVAVRMEGCGSLS